MSGPMRQDPGLARLKVYARANVRLMISIPETYPGYRVPRALIFFRPLASGDANSPKCFKLVLQMDLYVIHNVTRNDLTIDSTAERNSSLFDGNVLTITKACPFLT